MPDRIVQAVAIRRDLFQGVESQDALHDLIAKYARANLYDPANGTANARTVQRLTRDISRIMAQEFLPDAQAVAKQAAEPILDALGKVPTKLGGGALDQFRLYHKKNLQAFHVELRAQSGGLSGEVEAEFARAYRDGRNRRRLVTDLVEADKAEMARLETARGGVEAAGEKLANAESRLARSSKRKETRARRDVKKAKADLKKAEAKVGAGKTALGVLEVKVQAHARDAIRREAEAAQTAYFKQAGYTKFTWITVNSGEACPQCQERHGATYTSAQANADGPGKGGTYCDSACMCMLVPDEYHKIDRPIDLRGQAKPASKPTGRQTWRMRGPSVKQSQTETLRKIPKAKLSQAEKGALKEYTRGDYQTINAHLRKQPTPKDIPKSAIRGQIKEIDSALEKLPRYEGKTYRKVGFLPDSPEHNAFLAKHKPGRTVRYPGYVSTARTRDASLGSWPVSPKGDVRITFKGQTGRVIENYAASGTEQEVLFPRDSRFRVGAVGTTRGGGTDIILEEITNAY